MQLIVEFFSSPFSLSKCSSIQNVSYFEYFPILGQIFAFSQLLGLFRKNVSSPSNGSITIDTPELFAKLKAGEFEETGPVQFHITADATENVLAQPKHFVDSKYSHLVFQAADTSIIILTPRKFEVTGFFSTENEFRLDGFPVDYASYVLGAEIGGNISHADIDTICQWTNAKMLWLLGDHDAAVQLQQRIDQLKAFDRVANIVFEISPSIVAELRLSVFLDALKSLDYASFPRHRNVTKKEYDAFIQSQTIPSGWKCARVDGNPPFESNFTCRKN